MIRWYWRWRLRYWEAKEMFLRTRMEEEKSLGVRYLYESARIAQKVRVARAAAKAYYYRIRLGVEVPRAKAQLKSIPGGK